MRNRKRTNRRTEMRIERTGRNTIVFCCVQDRACRTTEDAEPEKEEEEEKEEKEEKEVDEPTEKEKEADDPADEDEEEDEEGAAEINGYQRIPG